MSTLSPFLLPHQKTRRPPPPPQPPPSSFFLSRTLTPFFSRGRLSLLVVASSSSPFDELHARGRPRRRRRSSSNNTTKNSVLLKLIHEIEPLDVSLIQKDVPPNTIDAMKRTISSMLGLLPSDQFHVSIEAFWEPLSKLLISSIMTGYTLRNAEYRLCLERNLDIQEDPSDSKRPKNVAYENPEMSFDSNSVMLYSSEGSDMLSQSELDDIEQHDDDAGLQGIGEMTPEVQEYISYLQARLSSAEEELRDIKRKNSALQMQHFVGEEKNDLLDYLRSLQPEKVIELSEPTCPEVQETVQSVVHGLLATLSPKIHSKTPPESTASGPLTDSNDDPAELVENTSLNFQPLISVSRDYLARLLFWCMLLGHYIRGLEYRLELMQILALPTSMASISPYDDYVA